MHLRRYPGRAIRRLRRPPQALRVVVKGRLTVAGPSGPPPHSPILNVSYDPTPSTRNQGPGLVGIGHFMVAWQHEPEADVNVVLSCVQRYANAAATPRVGDLVPDARWYSLYNCLDRGQQRAYAGTRNYYGVVATDGNVVGGVLFEGSAARAAAAKRSTGDFVIGNVDYFFTPNATDAESTAMADCLRGVYAASSASTTSGTTTTSTSTAPVATTTTQTCSGRYYTPAMAAARCPTEGPGPKPTAANQWPCPAGDTEITDSAGPSWRLRSARPSIARSARSSFSTQRSPRSSG